MVTAMPIDIPFKTRLHMFFSKKSYWIYLGGSFSFGDFPIPEKIPIACIKGQWDIGFLLVGKYNEKSRV